MKVVFVILGFALAIFNALMMIANYEDFRELQSKHYVFKQYVQEKITEHDVEIEILKKKL